MNLKKDLKQIEELTETLRLFKVTTDFRTKALLISYIQKLIRQIYRGERLNE